MRVIVGLGNPGKDYARTRHNVGWLLLDVLAPRIGGGRFKTERAVDVAEAFYEGEKIYLLKPQAYMNRSGQALASWLGTFREVREAIHEEVREPARHTEPGGENDEERCDWPGILVVSDDVNLPLGRLRMRPGGSAGGHNGLKDIEKALGSRGYPRLRLGVGGPPQYVGRADHVLGRFSGEELPALERMIAFAAGAALDWVRLGLEEAQNKYNGLVPED